MSLPRLFGTRLETIPATVPYLRANAQEAARWQARLASGALNIGIAWAGNPDHTNDARRSILSNNGHRFSRCRVLASPAFRSGRAPTNSTAHPGFAIADIAKELVGFAATAAVVEAADLVITINSAVAHLAGGLGKPVWLLTPSVSDWRWLLNREDNPWYPTMRLFRQAEGDTWPAVIARVAAKSARCLRATRRG